ncbi:hypothetical protein A8924_0846 [Saccharopolyspora erythraea NRRL 2338]|uniref:Uncharacterized protein n=2 Tax=Saccharopolyspora erythraea TaxID=1836 RepID=A4F6X3_SACEN|nr:hypothetical protein [Saccharopolyspora erythraea]EQD85472.1 hypothetical protein N599_14790 [Saccharopolyspora erythraea D]PFG93598.1 hypothetical protein A8924_0846 [Saccharopolyspora erythraea NRRL 2338]QRK90447.1 hypothetical protein JQX30_02735 [Saccharopolyspora erythraea]CAL99797.1 hypothetical protein SACE_0449 [Saccharopolyspora erythraea NRRL 2338]
MSRTALRWTVAATAAAALTLGGGTAAFAQELTIRPANSNQPGSLLVLLDLGREYHVHPAPQSTQAKQATNATATSNTTKPGTVSGSAI